MFEQLVAEAAMKEKDKDKDKKKSKDKDKDKRSEVAADAPNVPKP